MSDLIADNNDSGRHGVGDRTQDSGRHGARRAGALGETGGRRAERLRAEGRREAPAAGRHDAAAQDSGRHDISAVRATRQDSYGSADRGADRGADRRSADRHDSGRHAIVPAETTGGRAARRRSSAESSDLGSARYDSGRFSSVEEAARAGVYDTVTGGGTSAPDPADPGFGRGASTGSSNGSRSSTGAARRSAETGSDRPSYDISATTGRRRRAEAEEPATGARRNRRSAEARTAERSSETSSGSRRSRPVDPDLASYEAPPASGRRRADRSRGSAPDAYTRPADSDAYQVAGRYGTGPNPIQPAGGVDPTVAAGHRAEPTGTGRYDMVNGTGRADVVNGSGRPGVVNGTGRYDMVNGTGHTDVVNGTGRYDMANGTGHYAPANGTGHYDAANGAGRPAAPNGPAGPAPLNGTGRYDMNGTGRYGRPPEVDGGRQFPASPAAPNTGPNPSVGATGRYDRVGGAPSGVSATGRFADQRGPAGPVPTPGTGQFPVEPGMAGARPGPGIEMPPTGGYPTGAHPGPQAAPGRADATGRYNPFPGPDPAAMPAQGTGGRYPVEPPHATGRYVAQAPVPPNVAPAAPYATGSYPAPGTGPNPVQSTGRYASTPPPGGYGPADATSAAGMTMPPAAGYGPADATAAGGPARPASVPVGAYMFADQPGTGRYQRPVTGPLDSGPTAVTPPSHTGSYPVTGYPADDHAARSEPVGRPMRASAELVPVQRVQQRVDAPQRLQGPADRSGRFPAGAADQGAGGSGVRTFDLVKDYGSGPGAVRALAGISVEVQPNTFTAIMGPSGSGKSTLLHCMAGLDAPTSGRVFLGATDLTALPEKKLTRLRRDRVGFVFQSYALLPQLSVRQNIVLPLEVAGRRIDEQWLKMVVDALDLGKVLKQRATRLSGGQQQRVAMARALLPRPDVVFADEPTGALDAPTAREMLQFLRTSVHELGQTIVMVTHDPLAAEHTDHVLLLHQGGLAAQIANPTAPVVLEALTILDRMPAAGWQTGGYRAAMAPPAALPAAPRLALPAGSSAARPA